MTTQQTRAIEIATKILEDYPDGLQCGKLAEKVCEADPDLTRSSVQQSILPQWKTHEDTKILGVHEKEGPFRGLFILKKYWPEYYKKFLEKNGSPHEAPALEKDRSNLSDETSSSPAPHSNITDETTDREKEDIAKIYRLIEQRRGQPEFS